MRPALCTLVLIATVATVLLPATAGAAPAAITVHDFTTVNAPKWTALIIATIAEFNAVRPEGAPELLYVAESGDMDCVDLRWLDWDHDAIVICDTQRPEEFPDNPNIPAKGWAGLTAYTDAHTALVMLNDVVPPDMVSPAWWDDNTVCHELMHAYAGVEDNPGSDETSCVWGDLTSPGQRDIQLMRDRYGL